MTHAAITANFDQSLDVQVHFATQISLDLVLAVDYFTQTAYFFFRQILHPGIRVNACSLQDFSARGRANPIDVRQRNLHTLIAWNINAGDSSHLLLLGLNQSGPGADKSALYGARRVGNALRKLRSWPLH